MKKLIICLAVLVLSATFFAKSAAAATRLGSVNVQAACYWQYGKNYSAYLMYKNVYGWRCGSSRCADGRIDPLCLHFNSVDLSKECRRVYGSTAFASFTSYSNPYSWSCYRN